MHTIFHAMWYLTFQVYSLLLHILFTLFLPRLFQDYRTQIKSQFPHCCHTPIHIFFIPLMIECHVVFFPLHNLLSHLRKCFPDIFQVYHILCFPGVDQDQNNIHPILYA